MQYTSRIIFENKMDMLQPYVYSDKVDIPLWLTKEVHYEKAVEFTPIDEDYSEIKIGDHWQSTFNKTRFFKAKVRIPENYENKTKVLVLDLGGEGQVRINGEIVSGIVSYKDSSYLTPHLRSRVIIPEKYKAGEEIEIECECCFNFLESGYSINRPGMSPVVEYTVRTAFLATLEEEAEEYYFDLKNAVEAMDTFKNPFDTLEESNARIHNYTVNKIIRASNQDSYLHSKLFKIIMDSVNQLEFEFDRETLLNSIPKAKEVLKKGLESIPHKASAMVKFVGQSHIDTAWLWPLKETVRKCGKTFSNVLSLMDKYPEFIFAFSQPQLFAYLEEFYPDLFEKVKERVNEGRIELVGNAWVEMDTNVPSGESLVRQLLYGREYYLEKFGKESKVFWMPDVFGYTWALPQIMKRSGVDYFFTSKLVNNDTNNFPHSLFKWKGTDGTEILSYLQRLTYNGDLSATTLSEIYNLFTEKEHADTLLMTIGYGDGGGGPTYQMLEKAKRLKNFPGLPESEFATAESFFKEAEKCEDDLSVWNDEMYYEFHRGTYTSQADVKKNNRKGELYLRKTEIACTLAALTAGKKYPAKEIGDIWKKLLTNQFHDILPGSSIHEVYEDCKVIYKEIFCSAEKIFSEAMGTLNASLGLKENQFAVWNFLGFENSGTVKVSLKGDFDTVRDSLGEKLEASFSKNGDYTEFLVNVKSVPSIGVKIFTATKENSENIKGTATKEVFENKYLKLTFDSDGNILSLYDKEAEREVFTNEKVSNLLTIFEDIPHRESAWNIDMEYQNHFTELLKSESVELSENSEVRSVLKVVKKYNKSTITQEIILEKDAKRVDFKTHVDWYETQRMLKAAFYPDVLSSKATYEIQFGAIERPTHYNTSYDKAKFEVCGHKWADLSEGNYGVSILNDCKYGYDIKDNRMRITLLRAPTFPDPTGDKGVHDFVYSIYPHTDSWQNASTVKEAYKVNVPMEVFTCEDSSDEPVIHSFITVDKKNVIIDTIKGAQDGDGIIVRVYEAEGGRVNTSLKFGFNVKEAIETNLMEVNEKNMEIKDNTVNFRIKPFEVKTFRIK
ncbi:MAG: alpha-mannosidase [Ruminococcaceae bacterium]|nr:alpha-mannosidase [Oscillospiraceae bacterium]